MAQVYAARTQHRTLLPHIGVERTCVICGRRWMLRLDRTKPIPSFLREATP
jgi:hypothetical protein